MKTLDFDLDDKHYRMYHRVIHSIQKKFRINRQSAFSVMVYMGAIGLDMSSDLCTRAQKGLDDALRLRSRFRTNGYVYFMKAHNQDIFKIGVTKNAPHKRMVAVQGGCPYKLTIYAYLYYLDCQQKEIEFHTRLKKFRMHGEWFAVDEDMVDDIILGEIERSGTEPTPHNVLMEICGPLGLRDLCPQ